MNENRTTTRPPARPEEAHTVPRAVPPRETATPLFARDGFRVEPLVAFLALTAALLVGVILTALLFRGRLGGGGAGPGPGPGGVPPAAAVAAAPAVPSPTPPPPAEQPAPAPVFREDVAADAADATRYPSDGRAYASDDRDGAEKDVRKAEKEREKEREKRGRGRRRGRGDGEDGGDD